MCYRCISLFFLSKQLVPCGLAQALQVLNLALKIRSFSYSESLFNDVSYRSSLEFYYGSSNKWKTFVSNNHKSTLIYKCNCYCDCNGLVSSNVIYNTNRIKSMRIQTNVVHFQTRVRWLPIFPIAKHVFSFDYIVLALLHLQIKEKQ